MPYPCWTMWFGFPPTPSTDPNPDLGPGLGMGPGPDADCPTWRIDVHAAVPQPDGYDKRFQEQDTFDPDCAP